MNDYIKDSFILEYSKYMPEEHEPKDFVMMCYNIVDCNKCKFKSQPLCFESFDDYLRGRYEVDEDS
jgi:hypothetical protein